MTRLEKVLRERKFRCELRSGRYHFYRNGEGCLIGQLMWACFEDEDRKVLETDGEPKNWAMVQTALGLRVDTNFFAGTIIQEFDRGNWEKALELLEKDFGFTCENPDALLETN